MDSFTFSNSQENKQNLSSAVDVTATSMGRNGFAIECNSHNNKGEKENHTIVQECQHKKRRAMNSITASSSEKSATPSMVHETRNGSRRGDPRMNAAVEARLADPAMSLLDALLVGGFIFPGHTQNEFGVSFKRISDQDIYDNCGISLRQRKNQLGRRLRTIQRHMDSSMDMEVESEGSFDANNTIDLKKDTSGKNFAIAGTYASNSNLDLARALGTHAYPDKRTSSPPLFSTIANTHYDPCTTLIPPKERRSSTSINQEIFKSHLLKQLSQTYPSQPHNLLDALQQSNVNASAFSRNDASSSELLLQLQSALLLQQKAQQIHQYNKVPNEYNSISDLQQLLNSTTRTVPNVNIIRTLLEQQDHHSTDINQQLQNQINDLQNYIHLQKQINEMLRKRQEKQQGRMEQQPQSFSLQNTTTDSNKKVTPQNSSRKRKESSHSAVSDNDDDNIQHEKKKKNKKQKKKTTTHSHKSTSKNKNDVEDQTIKASSPRLKSAMKHFQTQFNKFTQSCMEEAGYTREECFELLTTFQNEVIRKSMNRKR